MQDRFGNLPIHRAATKKTPSAVVSALLNACPEIAKEKDEFEMTPLALAIQSKAHDAVVFGILEAHMEAQIAAAVSKLGYAVHFVSLGEREPARLNRVLSVCRS